MAVLPSEIKFLLSGGSSNNDPEASIGGAASSQIIVGTMNNLFDNVREDESAAGHSDYRCFYIQNSNETDTFYEARIYIINQVEDGATASIGVYSESEVQRMTLEGTITGGTMRLTYDSEETAAISWGGDSDVFRLNAQTALNDLAALGGMSIPSVSVIPGPPNVYYLDIHFLGVDDKRAHPLLVISDDSLTGGTDSSILRIAEGGPINAVASELDFDTMAPNGIVFSEPTATVPLEIGDLRAEEQFPVWVKRTTPASTDSQANDGFSIRVRGAIVE